MDLLQVILNYIVMILKIWGGTILVLLGLAIILILILCVMGIYNFVHDYFKHPEKYDDTDD